MIYIYGANCTGTYEHAHSEPIIGLDVAKALQKLGREATVAWGGAPADVEGVGHVPFDDVQTGEGDVLFAIQGHQGGRVLTDEKYAGLRAPTKVLYTSSYYDTQAWGGTDGVPLVVVWGGYDQVLVEARKAVPLIQAVIPTTPVEWCQLGCTYDVDLTLPSPYPEGEDQRHLFFAGRVSPWSLLRMKDYLLHTPSHYHLWVGTASVDVRPFAPDSVVGPWDPPALRCKEAGYTGPPCHYLLPCGADRNLQPLVVEHVNRHADTECAPMETVEAAARAVVTGGDPALNNRFHFLGPLPFGTFWHYHHHAFASVDFGFDGDWQIHNNCKIIDMLRGGARIIADGYSPTHYLIDQYAAGSIVPFADMAAAARVLEGWEVEPLAQRVERAESFRQQESWETRLAPLLARGVFGT